MVGLSVYFHDFYLPLRIYSTSLDLQGDTSALQDAIKAWEALTFDVAFGVNFGDATGTVFTFEGEVSAFIIIIQNTKTKNFNRFLTLVFFNYFRRLVRMPLARICLWRDLAWFFPPEPSTLCIYTLVATYIRNH